MKRHLIYALAVGIPVSAAAQSPGEVAEAAPEDIVVTASRRSETLQEVPISSSGDRGAGGWGGGASSQCSTWRAPCPVLR